jgi:hypothetical protein
MRLDRPHPTAVEVLTELDRIAGEVIAKWYIAFAYREDLEQILVHVSHAVQRCYTDGPRPIDDVAIMLVTALQHVAGPEKPEGKWLALSAYLHRCIREDLQKARELELMERATP